MEYNQYYFLDLIQIPLLLSFQLYLNVPYQQINVMALNQDHL